MGKVGNLRTSGVTVEELGGTTAERDAWTTAQALGVANAGSSWFNLDTESFDVWTGLAWSVQAQGSRSVRFGFKHGDTSPLVVATLVNEFVSRAVVQIQTAFNGANPTLELGTPNNAGQFLATTDINPKPVVVPSQYEDNGVSDILSTTVELTIVPDGSTVGAGFVFLTIDAA